MNDFQKIEHDLSQLANIPRSEEEKLRSWIKIENKIEKKKHLQFKPFLLGLASASIIFIGFMLMMSTLQTNNSASNNQASPNNENPSLTPSEEEPSDITRDYYNEEIFSIRLPIDEDTGNVTFPDKIPLEYKPVNFITLEKTKPPVSTESKTISGPYNIEIEDLSLNYFLEYYIVSGKKQAYINYEGELYHIGAVSRFDEEPEVYGSDFSIYPTNRGNTYYIGTIGSISEGYFNIIYDSANGIFRKAYSIVVPGIYDLDFDNRSELIFSTIPVRDSYNNIVTNYSNVWRWNNQTFEYATFFVNLDIESSNYTFYETIASEIYTAIAVYKGEDEPIIQTYRYDGNLNSLIALTNRELDEIANEIWQYKLDIYNPSYGGESYALLKDGIIYVHSDNLELVLHQFTNYNENIVSPGLYYREQIKADDFSSHMKLKRKPDDQYQVDKSNLSINYYQYKNLKKGDKIEIEVSDLLKEKLGLDTNIIQIIRE